MLLAHRRTLAQARSYVAVLADEATSIEASSAYERALVELDRMHGDEIPALDLGGLTTDRGVLRTLASSAIEELEQYGIDALSIELVLARLQDAYVMDGL